MLPMDATQLFGSFRGSILDRVCCSPLEFRPSMTFPVDLQRFEGGYHTPNQQLKGYALFKCTLRGVGASVCGHVHRDDTILRSVQMSKHQVTSQAAPIRFRLGSFPFRTPASEDMSHRLNRLVTGLPLFEGTHAPRAHNHGEFGRKSGRKVVRKRGE